MKLHYQNDMIHLLLIIGIVVLPFLFVYVICWFWKMEQDERQDREERRLDEPHFRTDEYY